MKSSGNVLEGNLSVLPEAAELLGDARIDSGLLHLGENGMLLCKGRRQPREAFSVEAYVRLRNYAPREDRWISDILNTATWSHVDGGDSRGFTLRVGGGELYPRQGNSSNAQTTHERNRNALASNCRGGFVIGTGGASWKEVYTDRCIDLGRWVHLVAVYNGKEMSIWVDGQDATDRSLTQFAADPPVLDSVADLNIGGRSPDPQDPRHFFGDISLARVVDSALSPSEIRLRCRALAQNASVAVPLGR